MYEFFLEIKTFSLRFYTLLIIIMGCSGEYSWVISGALDEDVSLPLC
jgi:hypothetical protein